MYKRKPKLMIETSERTDTDLAWLKDNDSWAESGEDEFAVLNRAIQVYADLQRAVQAGKQLYTGCIRSGSAELTLVTWE